MKIAAIVPPHRKLLLTPLDDTTCTWCDLRHVIDPRLRVAALVKILGRRPGRVVELFVAAPVAQRRLARTTVDPPGAIASASASA
jgi:hypothetical protein